MQKVVKGTKRLSRLLTFRSTTQALVEGQFDGSMAVNGTGDYTITFTVPFLRTPVISMGILTSVTIHQISAVSATSVRVKFFSATDGTTAKSADFHLSALGYDTADQT